VKLKVDKSVFSDELDALSVELVPRFEEAVSGSEEILSAIKTASYRFNANGELLVRTMKKYDHIDSIKLQNAVKIFMDQLLISVDKKYGKLKVLLDRRQ